MLWLGLASAASLWQDAYDAQPLPGGRDLASRDYFVVEIADPQPLVAAHGWTVEEPFPIADHWLCSAPRGGAHTNQRRSAHALEHGAQNFYQSGPSRLRRRAPITQIDALRAEFDIPDPLFGEQWHIFNPEEAGHDMNVIPVWRRNITGHNVTVAIVDDGLDYDHPDFEDSFSLEGSWDYNLHRQQPKPLLDIDTHGTRCAGEVAAGKNNVCGVGVAPGAKVAGIRILSGDLTTSDEARALIHQYNVNDIYSCSWGPSDDGKTIDGPPLLVKRAEVDGIENGRHGKGSIYVVASGNGDANGDNCNYDGYTNSIYSITVGAIDRQNRHPYYAESCSANMVVTYSSNLYDKITTSDRLDPQHPDRAKCTNGHSGTSAAAPIAAGVFALVLEQRPDLTWRDLQYLVRDTAQYFEILPTLPPSPAGEGWTTTADGHRYHNSYGYGLLDADAIVTRAETWELVNPQTWLILPAVTTAHPITPTTEMSLEVSQRDWDSANLNHIEHVRVRVSYQHEVRGSLFFLLESPAGIVSELARPRAQDLSSEAVVDWEFLSVVHWNETGPGVWRLKVLGPEEGHGVVTSWQLKFFGEAKDASLVKRYSEVWDEFEKPAGVVVDPIANRSSTAEGAVAPTEPPDEQDSSTSTAAPTEVTAEPTAGITTAGTTTTAPVSPDTTEPASSSSSAAAAAATSTEPTTKVPPPSSDTPGPSGHSLLFYIMVSVVGACLLGIILIPTIYLGFWRRKGTGGHYVQLDEDGFELNDLNDSFEIDDDDPSDTISIVEGAAAADPPPSPPARHG